MKSSRPLEIWNQSLEVRLNLVGFLSGELILCIKALREYEIPKGEGKREREIAV
jgi:hypothetical protein